MAKKIEELDTIHDLLDSIWPIIDAGNKEKMAGVIIGMAITAKAEAETQPA